MLVAALEGHRLWSESYSTGANPLLALEKRVMTSLLARLQPARALDVACGSGRWAEWLVTRGSQALGIDFCPEMLGQASPRVRGRLMIGRAEEVPVRDGFA